jgi:hypothetical protein
MHIHRECAGSVTAWLLTLVVALVAAVDNSRRAFYKEFRKVVEASDVVIQVRAVL